MNIYITGEEYDNDNSNNNKKMNTQNMCWALAKVIEASQIWCKYHYFLHFTDGGT